MILIPVVPLPLYAAMSADGPISWMSMLKSYSCNFVHIEAEDISVYRSVLLHFLELPRDKPITLLIDSKRAIALALEPVNHHSIYHIYTIDM